MPEHENLETELRDKLVERLGLDHIDPATIEPSTPLFKDGLELDSLDALEIAVLVEEEYGVVIGVAERNESVFGTLSDLARFVRENHGRDADKL